MSEWIEHDGWNGGCPTALNEKKVELRFRNGRVAVGIANHWTIAWCSKDGSNNDIVAYRLFEKEKSNTPTHDPVNKPSHYMLFPEQGIEFIDVRDVLIERLKDFSPKQIDYWSRAFEYLARAGGKNGVEDIKKAKWYLDRLVKTLEAKG